MLTMELLQLCCRLVKQENFRENLLSWPRCDCPQPSPAHVGYY